MNKDTVITYRNDIGEIRFSYDGMFGISDIRGVSAVDVELAQTQTLGQIGATVSTRSIKPKTITIDGFFFTPIKENRKKLIDVFAPGIESRLCVLQDNTEYFIEAEPVMTPDIYLGDGIQHFQITLQASYPYWRTGTEHVLQLSGIHPTFKFPFFSGGTFKLSTFSEGYFKEVENIGNTEMGFSAIFAARAYVENPEIYLLETGNRILFHVNMESGDEILINTQEGKLNAILTRNNGISENAYRYMDIQSDMNMRLAPGKNTFRCSATQGRENLSVRMLAYQGISSGL